MPEIKQTILSNVKRAVSNNNQTPQERVQERLLTSVNSNLRKMVKQGSRSERMGKRINKYFDKKVSSIKEVLIKIKKNTHPDGKGLGILKYLIFMFAGVLIKTVTSIYKAVKFLLKPFVWFGTVVKKLGKIIIDFGILLKKGFTGAIINPFKKLWKAITIISEGGRSGAKQLTKFGMAIEKFKFKFPIFSKFNKAIKNVFSNTRNFFGRGIKFFERTRMFVKNFKGVGIFSAIGNFFNKFKPILKIFKPLKMLLAPLTGILGKILFPIIALYDIFTGLNKAGKWFDKKKGESTTLKEKISAVFGQLVSTFTFGILSGKELALGFHKLFTKPSEFFKKDFPKLMKKAGTNLVSGLKKLGGWISKGVKYIVKFLGSIDWIGIIKTVGDVVIKGISKGVELFKTYFPIVITKIIDVFKSIDWVKVGEIFITVIGKLIEILWTVVKKLPGILWTVFTSLVPLLGNVLGGVGKLIWGALSGIGGIILDGLKSIFSIETLTTISEIGGSILEWGKNIITSIWNSIANIFKSEDDVGDTSIVDNAMKALSGLSENVISGIKDFVFDIVSGIGDALTLFKKIGGKIVKKIGDFFTIDDKNKDKNKVKTLPKVEPKPENIVKTLPKVEPKPENIVKTLPKVEPKPENIVKPATNITGFGSGYDFTNKQKPNQEPITATITKVENVDKIGDKIKINENTTKDETQKTMMDFLLNQFADVMAKKIGSATNKRSENFNNPPTVRVF